MMTFIASFSGRSAAPVWHSAERRTSGQVPIDEQLDAEIDAEYAAVGGAQCEHADRGRRNFEPMDEIERHSQLMEECRTNDVAMAHHDKPTVGKTPGDRVEEDGHPLLHRKHRLAAGNDGAATLGIEPPPLPLVFKRRDGPARPSPEIHFVERGGGLDT